MQKNLSTLHACGLGFGAGALLLMPSLLTAQSAPQQVQLNLESTPKVYFACYVPGTGTVYRIKEPGTPQVCGKTGQNQHIEFSWTDGAGGAGVPGPEGPMGPQGPQGEKGEKGDPGEGGVSVHGQLSGLNADDHPQYLLTTGARLSQGFAVTGGHGLGSIPATGGGVRMMWYPGKAAFRAGIVSGDQWDDHKIGFNSIALGASAVASGLNSFAVYQGQATGDGSFAFGAEAEAHGAASVALGPKALAIGSNSFATSWATARGVGATALWNGEAIANHTFAWLGRASNEYALALGLGSHASGNRSAAIGVGATASGEYALALGRNATASGPNSTAMGNNVSTGARDGSFIYGDNSVPGAANNSRNNQFAVRAQHIWLGTNNSVIHTAGRFLETSTGAYLTNGGTWTNSSDVNRKHLFETVDGEQVLRKLAELPISTWSYRDEEVEVRHMGPTAQDFRAAFGLGDTEKAISTVDADGVALAAVQALEARSSVLQRENRELRGEVDRLQREHHEMMERLARLEAALGRQTSNR